MKKITKLVIALNLIAGSCNAQSLTIQETLDYLNNILESSQHVERIQPLTPSYSNISQSEMNSIKRTCPGCEVHTRLRISLEKNGVLSFLTHVTKSKCPQSFYNVSDELIDSVGVYINDINLQSLQWKLYTETISNSLRKLADIDGYLDDNITNGEDLGYIFFQCVDNDKKCFHHKSKYGEAVSYDKKRYEFSSFGHKIDLYSENIKYDLKRFSNALTYLIILAKEKGFRSERMESKDPFVEANFPNSSSNKSGTEYKVPLLMSNGVYILKVNVGGIQSNFVLDSGAGECNINEDLELKLLAKGVIKKKNYLQNGLYRIADGSIVESRRLVIPKIMIGNKTFLNIISSITPEGSSNLLGQSFLNKTNSWSIDNSKKCLIIR